MGPMLAELSRHPDLGLLGYQMTVGPRGPLLVQYWRSAEHLQRFARDTDHPHLAAWRRFNRKVGTSGDVGVWHETYVVASGAHEAVYANMPRIGLAAAGEHVPVALRGHRAADRLRRWNVRRVAVRAGRRRVSEFCANRIDSAQQNSDTRGGSGLGPGRRLAR